MEVKLKVKHFIGATYLKKGECPISRSLNEHFETNGAWDAITTCTIPKGTQKLKYRHEPYRIDMYMQDVSTVESHRRDPEFTIRTITLN